MLDKNKRFLKKAIKTLPKLSKEAIVKFCKWMVQEQELTLEIIENMPYAIVMFQNDTILLSNSVYQTLEQQIPNLFIFEKTNNIYTIQDIHKKERVFEIIKYKNSIYTCFYINELTEFLYDHLSNQKQQSLHALEILAAGISHEIKNPLSAIDIHTQLLKYQIQKKELTIPEDINKYINIVSEESQRLLEILDTFLNKTRKTQLDFVFTEVSTILEKVYSLLEVEFNKNKINCIIEIETVPKIFTAPHILQQILLDLVRNAIEALENSKTKKILIRLTESNTKTHLVLSIEDSGKGIDSSIEYRVFDPYFTTKKNGSGLGLTLVKKMVDELGGDIKLSKSNRLGGARFELFFQISSLEQKLLI